MAEAIIDVRNVDVIEGLRAMAPATIHCVVTSPPYYGLRDYGIPGRVWEDGEDCAFGLEETLDGYIRHLVQIAGELKRVLHPRGTFWLNLGDSYAGGGKHVERKEIYDIPVDGKPTRPKQKGMSGKNLLMVPARVALALQEDGWILRQDIIWAKSVSFCPGGFVGSVMPESVQDRAVWSHEHIFQLALQDDYFYDIDGCREPLAASTRKQLKTPYVGQATKDYTTAGVQNPSDVKRRVLEGIRKQDQVRSTYTGFNDRYEPNTERGRNLRNVWVIGKQNFKGAHFATFPEKLVEPIIKVATSEAGSCARCGVPLRRQTLLSPVPDGVRAAYESSRGTTAADTGRTDGHTQRRPNHRRRVLGTTWEADCLCGSGVQPCVVLDPFSGSGRTGVVAKRLGRSYIGLEINSEYVTMSLEAIHGTSHGRTTAVATATAEAEPGAAESVGD